VESRLILINVDQGSKSEQIVESVLEGSGGGNGSEEEPDRELISARLSHVAIDQQRESSQATPAFLPDR
jgi:hypothetical protein